MAGDVTTTITELLNNADVLKKIAQQEAREKALAEVVSKRGKVAAAVVKQELRDLARIESGTVSSTQAIQANTDATGRLTAATGNLRAQFLDLAVQIQGGASPFTALSQQLPQIAEAAAGTTGALGTFAKTVGAAAIPAGLLLAAVSPLIPMYLDYQAAAEDAARAQELWNSQADIGVKHTTQVRDALNEALVATGVWTDEQGESAAIENKWADTLDAATAALWEEKRALDAQLESLTDQEGQRAALNALNEERKRLGKEELKEITIASGMYDTMSDRLAAVNAEIDKRNEQNEIGLAADKMAAKARRDGAEAARIEAEAARAGTKAAKDKTKADKEAEEAVRAYIAALEDLQKVGAGPKNKPGADDDPVVLAMRRQLAEAKSAAADLSGLTVREAEARTKAVEDAEFALQERLLAIDTKGADARAREETRIALRAVDAKQRAADDAARKMKVTDEELQAALEENARVAAEERAQIDAQLTETVENNYKSQLSKRWELDQQYINDRRAAEIKAAEDSAAAWAGFARSTETMIGNVGDFAATIADKMAEDNEKASLKAFRVHQAAEVVEATISAVRIAEEAAKWGSKINPAVGIAAGIAAFAAAEAAYVAPIAQQEPPSFNDTPSVQKMRGARGLVSLAEDDYFAAAKRPEDLQRQVDRFVGDRKADPVVGSIIPQQYNDTPGVQRMAAGQPNMRIENRLIVSGRTAQKFEQAAKVSRRGYTVGDPVAGRRRTRY